MKRIALFLTLALAIVFGASAKDTYTRNVSDLPQAAQITLSKNFKGKVSLIKIDKELGRISDYEVILTDGTEVEFDRSGNVKNVETPAGKSVPSALYPAAIGTYVSKTHKGARIVGLDVTRSGYEVELSNGLELKFDRQGKFLRYDD